MASVFGCFCGDNFTNLSNLNRHKAIHELDLPCLCQYCNFTSNRNDSLKRHVERYHQENQSNELNMATNDSNVETSYENMQPMTLSNQTKSVYEDDEFDKRLQLPHNFIYAGATQRVS